MKTSLATLLLLAAAGTAHADEAITETAPSPVPAWQLHGWMDTRWFTASSAVTLAEEPLTGGGASIERRIFTIGIPGPFEVLDLSAELGASGGSADGTTFQQLDNHVSAWQVTAGARARLPLFSWLHVQARAGVGGGRSHVRIADQSMSTAVADHATTMVATTGLGVALLPRLTSQHSAPFFMGIDAELGYQASTAMSVHAYPENRPAPELTIPAAYASLGDLDLSGWTFRIGTTIAF